MAEIAEQILVSIRSESTSVAEVASVSTRRTDGATAANERTELERESFRQQIDSSTELLVVGAEILEVCETETQVFVLVGVDRGRFAESVHAEARDLAARAAEARARAEQSLVELAPLAAAAAFEAGRAALAQRQRLAPVARVLGAPLPDSPEANPVDFATKRDEARASARVLLEITSTVDAALLQAAAEAAATAAGLSTAGLQGAGPDVPPAATLIVRFDLEKTSQVSGLYIVSGTLRVEAHASSGGAARSTSGKGSGLDAGNAGRDAQSRLVRTELQRLLGEVLAELGWASSPRAP